MPCRVPRRYGLWSGLGLSGLIGYLSLLALSLGGCYNQNGPPPSTSTPAALVAAELPPMIAVPAGPFLMGSEPKEREYGYHLDESLHNSTAARQYRWFTTETRRTVELPVYHIDRTPVTNAAYQPFVSSTGHAMPFVTETVWQSYGLIHGYDAVQRFLWRDNAPPPGRGQHPAVLISHASAAAYCAWRGEREGRKLRLPTEAEWEKAARGTEGQYFPWGFSFAASHLNSYDQGPYDTVPVGQYPQGQSPYGGLDMAGQVFEWTATPWPGNPAKYVVKGGSWDDLPGVTRAAARHGRPADLKHILVGFRCASSEVQ